jgi:CelD/BcsL family acetyltransferase involved in cellulose biosynthesis
LEGKFASTEVVLDGLARPLLPAAEKSLKVRVGFGLDELSALSSGWTSLMQQCANRRFHHLFSWHASQLKYLERRHGSVCFFSFHRYGALVAIVPLRLAWRRVMGIPLRVWELPYYSHVPLCDLVLADKEQAPDLLAALVGALDRVDPDWDALCFPRLLNDSNALAAIRSGPLPRAIVVSTGRSMYFDCRSVEAALRNASGDFKRNLRRQRKKLDGLGRVELVVADEPGSLAEAFQEFMRLEACGWKGNAGSAIRLQPHLVNFYQEFLQPAAADARCVITLLQLGNRAIAAQFGIVSGRTLNLLKIAYDEAFSPMAPGSLLLHESLKYCCDSPDIDQLSLVTGPAWAADRWNPEAETVWDAYLFNSSICGFGCYIAKRMKLAWNAAKDSRSNPRHHGK